MKPLMQLLLLVLCLGSKALVQAEMVSDRELDRNPNIVVVVIDDLRWDEFGAAGHPYVQTPNIDRIAREGALFQHSYAVVPLCSPNRASLLTGQYPSRHGIVDNLARNASSKRLQLFAKDLQQAGYATAHIGKWHMGNDPTPRPGYDYWVSYAGQGRSVNPILFENGAEQAVTGYMSDLLSARAVDFIRRNKQQPFMLYLAHKAIHPEAKQRDDSSVDLSKKMEYLPATRHQGRYSEKVLQRRANYIADAENNAFAGQAVLRDIHRIKNAQSIKRQWKDNLDLSGSENTIRRRAEMLLAVDEGIGAILVELERNKLLDNTLVVITSDNGYYYGEHGLSIERRMPYEEGVRVPLLMRFPARITPNTQIKEVALSIDVAPTLLDLAGIVPGDQIQGRSLWPLFAKNKGEWRDSFLIEYTSYEKPMPWLIDTSYKVVRKGNYKYIHWIQRPEHNELYDLEQDPYELNNLIGDPKHAELLADLRVELGRLVAAAAGI